MLFRVERVDDLAVVHLLRDLDFNTSRELTQVLEQVRSQGASGAILEMSRISYVASITIGVLVQAQQSFQAGGGRGMVLLKPQPRVRDILKLVQLGKVIPIVETLAEAKAKLARVGAA